MTDQSSTHVDQSASRGAVLVAEAASDELARAVFVALGFAGLVASARFDAYRLAPRLAPLIQLTSFRSDLFCIYLYYLKRKLCSSICPPTVQPLLSSNSLTYYQR